MVAGRRAFLQTLATGAAAGVAATVLPKVSPTPIYTEKIGRYEDVRFLKSPIEGQKHDLVIADDVGIYNREHGMQWYALFGAPVLERQNIVLMETA